MPAGELVFFRSFFGVFPVVAFLAWRGELRDGLKSNNVVSQIWRGLVGHDLDGARVFRADPAAAAGGGDDQLCDAAGDRDLLGDLPARDGAALSLVGGDRRARRRRDHRVAAADAVFDRRRLRVRRSASRPRSAAACLGAVAQLLVRTADQDRAVGDDRALFPFVVEPDLAGDGAVRLGDAEPAASRCIWSAPGSPAASRRSC